MLLRLPTALALLVVAACGGTEAPVVTGAPLTSAERALFEDGADFVADPEALQGQWRRDWSSELDQRVRRSDVIAYVKVQTLRTDTDLDRRTTFRLILDENRTIYGEYPTELVLRSKEGQPGYGTLEGNERQLLNRDFVLFLKWELADGAIERTPRWHLAPASDQVIQRVEYLVERRHDVQVRERGTVIVHEHAAE
ncbi:MAG: hypothetical protein AAGE52_39495 [Myxococcota bacterium]